MPGMSRRPSTNSAFPSGEELSWGVSAQYEPKLSITDEKAGQTGDRFLDMDSALREYPEIVQKCFGTIIPQPTTNLPR